MSIDPIILSIPLFLLGVALELGFQFWKHLPLYRLNDAITNISCGMLEQITGVYRKFLTVALYHVVYSTWHLVDIPTGLGWFILLFVLADLCYYWSHRASHRVNLFWGGHIVHHQSEEYNLSVALRQGSWQGVWTTWFYLPLALIGFDTASYSLAYALVTIYQFWIHTELIGHLGPLEWILNTPSHHRVHHGRDPDYIDMNYGGVFIIWDRLFGTFVEEKHHPTYGITKRADTWNPVWANLQHYSVMWQQFWQLSTWKHRFLYLIKPPGWTPDGEVPIPPLSQQYSEKYDQKPATQMQRYLFVQYVAVILLGAVFLFTHTHMEMGEKLGGIFLIALSLVSIGGMMEQRRWAVPVEILRIPCLVLYFQLGLTLGLPLLIGSWGGLLWAASSQRTHTEEAALL